MASILRISLAAAFTAGTMGAALPRPATAEGAAGAGQEAMEGRVQATAIAPTPATETLRGVVDSVDEGHDTLKVRLSQDKTEEFKVRDGLIFNAVRFGDTIEVTVEKTGEKRTIVSLRKE
jgi:Cu/Ag efflux protein CusF